MGNQYYHTDSGGYSIIHSQFNDAMAREGTKISDYWDPAVTYPCIFRRNKDANKSTDHTTIFYPVDAGIRAGQLLNFQGQVYLTLNQESAENGTYYRSDLIKSNTNISTFFNNIEICIPAIAKDLTDIALNSGTTISTIGGTVQLMTEDCNLSRNIGIDAEFTSDMSGHWKIVNSSYRNGISYFYAERIQSSVAPIYTLSLIGHTEHNVGSSTALTVLAQRDGSAVENPTITWSSSDTDIASIAPGGIISLLSAGEVVITATWTEHNVVANMTIAVAEEAISYRCEISGRSDLRAGFTRNYTAVFYAEDGTTVIEEIIPLWSLDVPTEISGQVSLTNISGNTVTVSASGGATGYTITLILEGDDGIYRAEKLIEILDIV